MSCWSRHGEMGGDRTNNFVSLRGPVSGWRKHLHQDKIITIPKLL